MKKIASIGLLTLLLFNWCGYRLVADWLQTRAEQRLEVSIDKGMYDAKQLVELSVITNLPYANDWLNWERCSGTIEVNGYHYQYVERKLQNGKMFYHCLPSNEKQSLATATEEFSRLVNNFNQSTDNKNASKSIVINNFIGDYDEVVTAYSTLQPPVESSENSWPSFVSAILTQQMRTPHQPPEC